jgi:ferric-dicitrate binding protein FerR (iron transport regulator)
MTGQHLTDEQFTDLLSGDCPSEAIQHMKMCTQCQSEFERVQSSIEDFGTAGLLWAEQRPAPRIHTQSVLVRGWRAVSSRTAAAALLATVLFGAYQQKRMQAPVEDPLAATPAHSESQVADDNQLMMAIDQEIRWQADSPVAVEHLAEGRVHFRVSRRLAN